MSKNKTLRQVLSLATLATMFAAAPVYAQSSSSAIGLEAGGALTMDASGKTQANREGQMSPTGQNETISTEAWLAGSSGASGSSASHGTGAASAETMDASGKTLANREGRMSPTGQNETIAFAGSHAASGSASGNSAWGGAGAAGAETVNAAGKTQANREGRMSPTGQNETRSVMPTAVTR